jgi:hypothetical protein
VSLGFLALCGQCCVNKIELCVGCGLPFVVFCRARGLGLDCCLSYRWFLGVCHEDFSGDRKRAWDAR